jgi:KDO2-lipid IV(A) lauroyltransferase
MYYLLKGVLFALSYLPFWLLYLLSDLLFLLAFYLLKYRRKVVTDNLRKAFPEKDQAERDRIARAFYRHLCDLLVEALKGVSMSARQLEKRMRFQSPEVIREIARKGEGTLIIASHYGNFEWTNSCVDYHAGEVPTYSIYHPLKNEAMERLLQEIRTRWGTTLLTKQEAFRGSVRALKSLCLIGFMTDQSPSRRKHLYFSSFLGQPTAMHEGAALLAVGRNRPAYFADVRKLKRGYYSCTLIPIPTEQFVEKKDMHGFTDYHAALLEAVIREEPAYWLWSHRRWKHQPRTGDELSEKLKS